MKTFMNSSIPEDALGIVYLGYYNREIQILEITTTLFFYSPGDALEAYANIPNPESQMASGSTKEEFEKELIALHAKLNNPIWVRELSDYI